MIRKYLSPEFTVKKGTDIRYSPRIVYGLIASIFLTILLSVAIAQILICLLFLLWLFDYSDVKKAAITKPVIILLTFLLARVLTIAFSGNPAESIIALPREIFLYMLLLAIASYWQVFKINYTRLADIYFFAAAVIAIIGIFRFAAGFTHRAESITSGYTAYSFYLLISLIFLFSIISKDRFNTLWFYPVTAGLAFAGIITSLGRVNIVLAGIVAAFFLLRKYFSPKNIIIMTVIVVVVSGLAFSLNKSEIQNRIEQPAALSDRDIIWKGFFEIAKENPVLGFGPRSFSEVFPFKDEFADRGISSWHNEYFQLYIEGGIISLGIYIFFLASVWISEFRKILRNRNRSKAGLMTAVLIPVLAAASLTDGFITSLVPGWILGIMFGIYSAQIKEEEKESLPKNETKPGKDYLTP